MDCLTEASGLSAPVYLYCLYLPSALTRIIAAISVRAEAADGGGEAMQSVGVEVGRGARWN